MSPLYMLQPSRMLILPYAAAFSMAVNGVTYTYYNAWSAEKDRSTANPLAVAIDYQIVIVLVAYGIFRFADQTDFIRRKAFDYFWPNVYMLLILAVGTGSIVVYAYEFDWDYDLSHGAAAHIGGAIALYLFCLYLRQWHLISHELAIRAKEESEAESKRLVSNT